MTITPSAAATPKRCRWSVSATTSEPKPIAVVNEVRKHATMSLRSVGPAASTRSRVRRDSSV